MLRRNQGQLGRLLRLGLRRRRARAAEQLVARVVRSRADARRRARHAARRRPRGRVPRRAPLGRRRGRRRHAEASGRSGEPPFESPGFPRPEVLFLASSASARRSAASVLDFSLHALITGVVTSGQHGPLVVLHATAAAASAARMSAAAPLWPRRPAVRDPPRVGVGDVTK